MALKGFNYAIRWNSDFTTRTSPPSGKEDLIAFTEAPAGTSKEIKAKKGDDGLYYVKESSVEVSIKMIKKDSWVLKDKKTDKLLKHEQLHYNISALGGRDLERGLKKLSAGSPSELVQKISDFTQKIQSLIDKINIEYDNTKLWGTNHGRIKLHQDAWELHINKLKNDPNGELKSIYYVMQR